MLYRLLHWLAWPLGTLVFGLKVRGVRHVPASGGAILAANHASFLDPVLIGCALAHRRVHFMAKEELFAVPGFGAVIRALGAIPVRRGGVAPASLRRFMALVGEAGSVLAVFPEGTRTPDGRLGPARRGVGAIARAAGVPVIPVFVEGTFAAWPRFRRLPRWHRGFEVRFGPPIQWADRELDVSGDPSGALARSMMNAISELEHPQTLEPSMRFRDGMRALWRTPVETV